jgi:hypothetical protein
LQQQQQQNEYNMNLWQQQMAYNSPQAAMQRLTAAGINPNLVVGGVAGGAGLAAPPPQSAKAEFVAQPHPAVDLGSIAARSIQAFNDTRLGTAQVSNMESQTINTAVDSALKGAQVGATIAQTAKTGAETGLVAHQASALDADVQLKQSQIAAIQPQIDLVRAETQKALADTQFTLNDDDRRTIQNAATIQQAYSQILLNHANALKAQAETSIIPDQKAKLQAEATNLTALTNDANVRAALGNADLMLKQAGLQPHDSFPSRVLGTILNGRFQQTSPAVPINTMDDARRLDSLQGLGRFKR